MSLFLLFGCATHSEVHLLVDNSGGLFSKLQHLYPERFTMYHRVILTVRGKNYDFNGYLTCEDGNISAVGFNDLGGRLFHITSSQQKVKVLSKPDRMPASVLRSYLVPELNAIFPAAMSGARIARSTNMQLVLIHGQRNIEYRFNSTLQRCETIIISQNNEKISVIQSRDYQIFAGWNQEIPQTITVFNQKWDYQMTLRLLQIKSS